ncbi:MAG TPA: porin [Leptolyngbyaceae cyanobacterium M33_DOE_097]|uniref:Porin n=1 Tax=Oscillatoriales cyanobacterium SpSt-418 TaxID=2282169 RepID=A0A7C3PF86_9CYAN|nr:porin [Leptolyngbyaceae cyanobacterium M33_DOE_097]
MYLGIRSDLWRSCLLRMNLRADFLSYLPICPLIALVSSCLTVANPAIADEKGVYYKVDEDFALMDSSRSFIDNSQQAKKDLEEDHKSVSLNQLPRFQINREVNQNVVSQGRDRKIDLFDESKLSEAALKSPQAKLTDLQTEFATAKFPDPVFGHLEETERREKAIGTSFSGTAITHPLPVPEAISTGLKVRSREQAQQLLAQASPEKSQPEQAATQNSRLLLGSPSIQLQGVFLQEGEDTSARARLRLLYPVTPNALFGAEVDVTTGNGFSDTSGTGINLNELYFAGSLPNLPELRFVVGLMDLTSYFDRNSFAKDGATHFFNRAFQTNPALSAAGVSSRVGVLVNWAAIDNLELKVAAFSSSRDLGDFDLNGFAGELEYRIDNFIVRGTYVRSKDAGADTGFEEIFDLPRDDGDVGLSSGDREEAFGINAEWYIPNLKLGLFGRFGYYQNESLDEDATTFSFGVNLLDLFMPDDRLGIGYGRQLSNNSVRRDLDDPVPDVLEVFYDARVLSWLRAGVMVQQRNEFTETVFGVRLRADWDLSPRR